MVVSKITRYGLEEIITWLRENEKLSLEKTAQVVNELYLPTNAKPINAMTIQRWERGGAKLETFPKPYILNGWIKVFTSSQLESILEASKSTLEYLRFKIEKRHILQDDDVIELSGSQLEHFAKDNSFPLVSKTLTLWTLSGCTKAIYNHYTKRKQADNKVYFLKLLFGENEEQSSKEIIVAHSQTANKPESIASMEATQGKELVVEMGTWVMQIISENEQLKLKVEELENKKESGLTFENKYRALIAKYNQLVEHDNNTGRRIMGVLRELGFSSFVREQDFFTEKFNEEKFVRELSCIVNAPRPGDEEYLKEIGYRLRKPMEEVNEKGQEK